LIEDRPSTPAAPAPDPSLDLPPAAAILERVAAGITVQDELGQVVYANEEAAKLSGWETAAEFLAASAEERLGRFELIDEDGGPFDWQRLPGRRVLAGEPGLPTVVGFRMASGDERWSLVTAQLLEIADRRYAVNSFYDLTQRVTIEREARDHERQYLEIIGDINDRLRFQEDLRTLAEREHARAAELTAVIGSIGHGVFVCDAGGRIILSNPTAEDFFPDVEEETFEDILAQLEGADELLGILGREEGPIELRARGGVERWVELSTWPVGEETHGERRSTIVTLRDVTRFREQQVMRDTFISVLSHELRTPVTTIYAGAKVLSRDGPELAEPIRAEIFADIVTEAERLHRLVEDVIAMTRFGEGGGDVGAEPVLLQRILPGMVAAEAGRWPGIAFRSEVGPGLPTVSADPTYVEQVVRNLLSNAAKYGGRGTEVLATVEAAEDEVLVRILDTGPGFPEDEADRLFELFFRSAGTARATGAGIGLFVCARLIRAMGGRIWARNRPEGGSEFGFSLRRIAADD
jgi:PAS domain S-box-containing protein